jgi:hypothetical protein
MLNYFISSRLNQLFNDRMKKTLFFCLSVSLFLSCSDVRDESDSIIVEATTVSQAKVTSARMATTVVFGRHGSDCAGRGACSFSAVDEITGPDPSFKPVAGTFIMLSPAPVAQLYTSLTVQFNEETIETVRDLFGGDYLELEEAFVIEDGACNRLGLAQGFTIPVGVYELTYNKKTGYTEAVLPNLK